jgi:hypothetical protein
MNVRSGCRPGARAHTEGLTHKEEAGFKLAQVDVVKEETRQKCHYHDVDDLGHHSLPQARERHLLRGGQNAMHADYVCRL